MLDEPLQQQKNTMPTAIAFDTQFHIVRIVVEQILQTSWGCFCGTLNLGLLVPCIEKPILITACWKKLVYIAKSKEPGTYSIISTVLGS